MNETINDIFCSHDKLFKEIWSDLENARSFLANYLPEEYLAVFDLKTLEICKGSFVEKNLKEYHSDLLYKVATDHGHAFIYFLFEHKSYPDGLIHLQLLKYMTGIWELSVKQNRKKRFDAIVPLVMYHGKKQWTTPERFTELFSDAYGPFGCHIPDFKYILFDLPQYSDEQIRGTIIERLVMLVFKHIFDNDFDQKLPGIFKLLEDLVQKETGLQYVESLLRYLLSNMENMTGEKLKAIVAQSLSEKEGGVIMKFADSALGKIYNKGMHHGISQGINQGISQGISQGIQQSIHMVVQARKDMAITIIDLKFGHSPESERFKRYIDSIDDADHLALINEKLKSATTLADLSGFIGH